MASLKSRQLNEIDSYTDVLTLDLWFHRVLKLASYLAKLAAALRVFSARRHSSKMTKKRSVLSRIRC